MACQEKKKLINEKEYYCRQLPATKALPLKFELGRILGASLPSLFVAKGGSTEAQAEAFGKAIENLFTKTNPEQLMDLIKRVVSNCTVDGKRIMEGVDEKTISFDDLYTDNFKEMYLAFYFVLEVNYGNFFKGFGLSAEVLKAKIAELT